MLTLPVKEKAFQAVAGARGDHVRGLQVHLFRGIAPLPEVEA